MRVTTAIVIIGALAATPVLAQQATPASAPAKTDSKTQLQPIVPMAAIARTRKLSGRARVRYILRQLDLTEEQKQFARDVMASIYDSGAKPPLDLAEVYSIAEEIKAAKAKGDEARAKELGQQLRDLAKKVDQSDEVLMNMEDQLTAKQKQLLKQVLQRLERNPRGVIRPLDVFRAARQLDLTKEQSAKLDEIVDSFRKSRRKMKREPTDEMRYQMMNSLMYSTRGLLTPEQKPKFDLAIGKLRPDLGGLKILLPSGGIAEPATGAAKGKAGGPSTP